METYAAPIYQMYLWGNVAFGLVQGALCFAGIIWLMKHKLNL
jgi:hypothetical protein